MTEADREMLVNIYWTLVFAKCVFGFYCGLNIKEWVVKRTNGE